MTIPNDPQSRPDRTTAMAPYSKHPTGLPSKARSAT